MKLSCLRLKPFDRIQCKLGPFFNSEKSVVLHAGKNHAFTSGTNYTIQLKLHCTKLLKGIK